MKQVKPYLRSTTSDCRLNHLMVLHVQKNRTDSLNMVEVANASVEENYFGHPIFGIFREKDGVPKEGTKRAATQTHFEIRVFGIFLERKEFHFLYFSSYIYVRHTSKDISFLATKGLLFLTKRHSKCYC